VNVIKDYVAAVRNGKSETFITDEKPCGALLVKREKLAENGEFNLTGDRYRTVESSKHQKWPMVELREISEILNGFAFKSEKYLDAGIRVIRITNVQKGQIVDNDPKFYPLTDLSEIERFILKKDDLLLSLTGNVGRVGLIPESLLPAALNQRVACLRLTSEKILHSYLYSTLNTDLFENSCIDAASGVAQKNLSTEWLKKFKIPLPPLEVQREIVAEIEGYQKLIDGCRQVVDSWKPQIDIDPEWPMVKLGDVFSVISGYSFDSKDFIPENPIKCIKITNVGVGEFINDETGNVPVSFIEKYSNFIANAGDIVISLTRSIISAGLKIAIVPESWNKSLVNQRVAVIKPQDNNIKYLFSYLTTEAVYRYVEEKSKSLMQPNLSINDLKLLPVPLPNPEIQNEIVSKIESERIIIDGCRELIKTYEDKIKRVIDKVWEE